MIASKLILGTVQMGISYGINNSKGKIPFQESISLLKNSFDQGIHYLDTAEAYGNAHEIIGAYHQEYPNQKFNVLTKLPHNFSDGFEKSVYTYMEEMRASEIWGLSFHSFESYRRNFNKIKNEINELKKLDVINNLGVSVYNNNEAFQVIENPLIDIIQLPFNLFDNVTFRGDILKKAKEHGKEIHVRSCFLQGLFFKDTKDLHPIVKALKNELLEIHKIANNYKLSIHELALNYVYQHPLVDKVLIGVDNTEQLLTNLAALKVPINTEAYEEVEKIKIKNEDLLNPSLWKLLMS